MFQNYYFQGCWNIPTWCHCSSMCSWFTCWGMPSLLIMRSNFLGTLVKMVGFLLVGYSYLLQVQRRCLQILIAFAGVVLGIPISSFPVMPQIYSNGQLSLRVPQKHLIKRVYRGCISASHNYEGAVPTSPTWSPVCDKNISSECPFQDRRNMSWYLENYLEPSMDSAICLSCNTCFNGTSRTR